MAGCSLWVQFLCFIVCSILTEPCPNHPNENGTSTGSASATWECACPLKNCIRKCCADDQVFVEDDCVDNPGPGYEINITVFEGTNPIGATDLRDFRIIHGNECPENFVRFSPDAASDVFLQADGSLLVESFQQFYPPQEFCIDVIDNETSALLCELPESLRSEERTTFAHVVIVFAMLLWEVQNDSGRNLAEDEISECETGQCVQTCRVIREVAFGTNCTNVSDIVKDILNANETFTNLINKEAVPRKCKETIWLSPGAMDLVKEDGLHVLQSIQLTLNYTQYCVDTDTFNASLLICILGDGSEHFHSTEMSFDSLKENCVGKNCVRKCCGLEQSIFDASCADTGLSNFSLSEMDLSDDTHFLIFGELKCNDGYLKIRIDDFKPNLDGSIYWEEGGSIFEIDSYCLDKFSGSNGMDYGTDGNEISAFVCVEDEEEIVENQIHLTGMIISMPFLLLTFLVYAILPETSLHRKALMSYVLSLFAGYVFIVTTQLSGSIPSGLCNIMGYSIIFFFTVSFFWMNVMCIDMWLAFSGMRVYNGIRGTEKKRFIFYCLYAWGMPLVHIFIVFMLNNYGDQKSIYNPQLGIKRCFVEDGLPEFLYFYLPMAIVIVINIVLFILTTVRIQQVKRETAMLKHGESKRHSYEDDKQKFNLYLKLMLAMGINWSMELISWAVNWKLTNAPTWIWYLTDFTNATYGVVIFFIFVFKKKIWISLKKRYYVWIGKPHLAHSMSRSTQGTRTSNFSTTDTAVTNDYRLNNMKNGREEERALN